MKRQLFSALTTVTFLATYAVAAQAQDTTKTRTDTSKVTRKDTLPMRMDTTRTMGDTVRKESRGDVANLGAPTFSDLLGSINAMPTAISKLSAITNLTAERVHLVDVKDVIHGGNEEQFVSLTTQNHDTLSKLHAVVKNNPVIFGAMRTHPAKIDVQEVVAATVADNGDVYVYYRKK